MSSKEFYDIYKKENEKKRNEFQKEYAEFLLSLPVPMSYKIWCYLHSVIDRCKINK